MLKRWTCAAATTAVALLTIAGCGSSGSGSATGGSDADMACALVRKLPERMPDTPPRTAGTSTASPDPAMRDFETVLDRLGAAQVLAKAAALADARRQPLADALDRAQARYATTFDVHAAEPDIKRARGMC